MPLCACDHRRQPRLLQSTPSSPKRNGPGLRCWCGGACDCHAFAGPTLQAPLRLKVLL
jgi:hypothetical protein